MTVLHISNDYSGSTVYKNLVSELDRIDVSQIVYNPIRDVNRVGKNLIKLRNIESEIIYAPILNHHTDRVFYRLKIRRIAQDIERRIDLTKVDVIHAHTWYSDGGAAYLLSCKYDIPYIVTIRNSDVNVFYKYLLHERSFGHRILRRACDIIMVSAAYKDRFFSKIVPTKYVSEARQKLSIIPNGVDPFWIHNRIPERRKKLLNGEVVEILYIGKFNKGKQVANLICAIQNLNRTDSDCRCRLTLVGGGGNDESRVLNLVREDPNIVYKGAIFDHVALQKQFQSSDIFAMPSLKETFGLVYIEALLQGIPVVYTRGEGIDRLYDDNIGEKVNASSVDEIARNIMKIISKYSNYDFNIDEIAENHDWTFIAEKYRDIYCSINTSKHVE